MDPDLLARAAAEGTQDSLAREWCLAHGTGANLIASVDNSSPEVLAMVEDVATRGGWDKELLEYPNSYAALCIYDVKGQSPPHPESSYVAQFVIVEEHFAGNQILTFW